MFSCSILSVNVFFCLSIRRHTICALVTGVHTCALPIFTMVDGMPRRGRGVIAMSAGNHAQGVAHHATRLGIPSTIVMPRLTPFAKVARTEAFGATVELFGESLSEAQAQDRKSTRLNSSH